MAAYQREIVMNCAAKASKLLSFLLCQALSLQIYYFMFLKLRRIYWVRNGVQNFCQEEVLSKTRNNLKRLFWGSFKTCRDPFQSERIGSCKGSSTEASSCSASPSISTGGAGFTFHSLMRRRYLCSITCLGLCLEDKGAPVWQNLWGYQNLSFPD